MNVYRLAALAALASTLISPAAAATPPGRPGNSSMNSSNAQFTHDANAAFQANKVVAQRQLGASSQRHAKAPSRSVGQDIRAAARRR